MSLTFLGGLNGVGKSAIAERASQNRSLKTVQGSERLMKELGLSAGEYEKLQGIAAERKKEATERVFDKLEMEAEDEDLIVTAHYTKVLRGEVVPSFGPWYEHCDKLVLVIASPEEILERIDLDSERIQRNLFGSQTTREEKLEFLKEAQELSRKVFRRIEEELEVPTLLVENEDGKVEETTDKVVKFIQRG